MNNEIRDYADDLAYTYNTDDLMKLPSDKSCRLRSLFCSLQYHDFADLFALGNDEAIAFKRLQNAVAAWGRISSTADMTPEQRSAAVQAYEDAAHALAVHLVTLAISMTAPDAHDALTEAYDAVCGDDDGIAAEDERARVRDWNATA